MGLTVDLLKNDSARSAEKRATALKQTGKIAGVGAIAYGCAGALDYFDATDCEGKVGKHVAKVGDKLYTFLSNRAKALKNSQFVEKCKTMPKEFRGMALLGGILFAGCALAGLKVAIDTRYKFSEIDKKYDAKAAKIAD